VNSIIKYLKQHFKEDFQWKLYGIVGLYLAFWIWLNYKYNIEKGIIDAYIQDNIRFLWYFILYSLAYFPTVILWCFFNQKIDILRTIRFWIFSTLGMAILAFDGGFYYHYTFSQNFLPAALSGFAYRCGSGINSLITIVLPLFIFYKKVLQPKTFFYGLNPTASDLKPYGMMLLMMTPLIAGASFQDDFLTAYPAYKPSDATAYFGMGEWFTISIYEFCYGFDFISTELIFRGFLIIGMTHILGRGVVLPMVVTYAFLHFGKPLGETIGSIFGGYILGVIALYSRSIWGGIAIHLGIAWLMETFAFLQLENLKTI
jgi:hypothetical protein